LTYYTHKLTFLLEVLTDPDKPFGITHKKIWYLYREFKKITQYMFHYTMSNTKKLVPYLPMLAITQASDMRDFKCYINADDFSQDNLASLGWSTITMDKPGVDEVIRLIDIKYMTKSQFQNWLDSQTPDKKVIYFTQCNVRAIPKLWVLTQFLRKHSWIVKYGLVYAFLRKVGIEPHLRSMIFPLLKAVGVQLQSGYRALNRQNAKEPLPEPAKNLFAKLKERWQQFNSQPKTSKKKWF